MTNLSNTQIDRLGDRLREASLTESDLRLLDDYRRSFRKAYETVVRTIREGLQLEPSGRPAKSTGALVEKLRRESIRLSQMQDITGCRVVVADLAEQERAVASLRGVFPGSSVIDRRADPSHGYRAVHVIVRCSGKLVEIQIRTSLQHLWAEISEKLSDLFDPNIKYGGGDDKTRRVLATVSVSVLKLETLQQSIELIANREEQHVGEQIQQEVRELQEQVVRTNKEFADMLNEWIYELGILKGLKP